MSEQRLSSRMRDLRRGRNMSQEKLATSINVSKSLITSFETGRLIPQDDTAKSIDNLFGTGDEVQGLAKREREDRQPWLRPWVEQERRAVLLRTYQPLLVPGLLQCEPYMRAVISAVPGNAGKVDELVATRRGRQTATIERDDPVPLYAVISEVALRTGPPEILKEQLGHLVDVGHRSHVRVRMVPMWTGGLHAGLAGPFIIATLPEGRRAGYMDDQLVGHMATGNGDLDTLELAWAEVDALALPVDQSRDAILRMLDEHR